MPAVATRRLTAMTLGFALSNATTGVAVLLTSVAVGRGFGAEAFGVWTLATVWAAALGAVADLGFGVLITREAAADRARAGALVGAAIAVRMAALVPVSCAFLLGAGSLGVPSGRPVVLVGALALAAASAVYGCIAAALRTSPAWLLRMVTIESAGAFALLAGAAVMVAGGGTIEHLLVLAAALQAAQAALASALWSRAFGVDSRIEWPTLRSMRAALTAAWPFAAAGLVANVQVRMAPLALGVLSSPAAVAWFASASRLVSVVRIIPYAALGGALPVLAESRDRSPADGDRTAAGFERALGVFAVAAAVAVASVSGPLLASTYGTSFAEARPSLVWLAIGLAPTLMNAGRRVAMTAAGLEQVALAWSVVAFVVQAVCTAAWIPGYGAAGAAAALTVGEAAVWWPLRRTRARTQRSSSRHHA